MNLKAKQLFTMISIFILLLGAIYSCKKKQLPYSPTDSLILGSQLTLNVQGRITDELGQPIEGAIVKAGYGNQTTQTDVNGVFRFENIKGFKNLGFVTVSKSGYFNGSRSFLPIETEDNFVRISLIKKNLSGQFQSTNGGTILSNGVKVVFPANAITRNGIDYNGIVKVYVCNIDPDDENIADLMPGSLFGEMNYEAKLLVSFGMVNVELKDSENNSLQIKSGQKATVHFPLPNSFLADSPEKIDLWHFDETQGFWKNEGIATKIGNEYIAEVGHFSWWNCDQPENFSRIEVSVKDNNNKHMSNIKVVFETSSFGNGIQYTNSEGNISAMIRKDVNVTAKLFMLCSGNYSLIHTQVLGSTFTETNHSIVIPQLPSIITVSGQVKGCDNLPVERGYVIANNQVYFCNEGKYDFLTCDNILKIYAVDQISEKTSNIVTTEISGQNLSFDLVTCNDIVLSSVTDLDGYNYKTVKIGTQIWMAENLRTTKYSNGDSIPKVKNSQTWGSLTSGAYCTYNNGEEKGQTYGNLYNYYVISDNRNVCPSGWHIPSSDEVDLLTNYLTNLHGTNQIGGKLKAVGILSEGTGLWRSPNIGATDEYGFNALPGGYRTYGFQENGNQMYFWFKKSTDPDEKNVVKLSFNSDEIIKYPDYETYGISVRCIKD